MDMNECRTVMVDGIDKALNHPIIAGIDSRTRAVMLAARTVIISNDQVVNLIAGCVGPFHRENTEMANKAIDWAALLTKLEKLATEVPSLALLVAQIAEKLVVIFGQQSAQGLKCDPCDPEIECALSCQAEAILTLIENHFKLCCKLNCCCK